MLETKKYYKQKNFHLWIFIRRLLIILIGLAIIWLINLVWYKPFNINLFYERTFLEYAGNHPEMLSKIRYYDRYGINIYNKKIDNVSDQQKQEEFKKVLKHFEMLRSYDLKDQNEKEKLSAEILDYHLQDNIFQQQFPYYNYTIDHITGMQINFPMFMVHYHPINNLRDAENYLKRLSFIPERINQIIEGILIREEYNAVAPKVILNKCIAEIKSFSRGGIYKNILYNDFKNKIAKIENIPEIARSEYLYEVKREIEDNTIPSFLYLAKELERAESINTEQIGVWRFDEGEYFYDYLLQKHLSVDQPTLTIYLTVDSLLKLAYKEIAIAEEEINKILIELGKGYDFKTLLTESKKDFLYESGPHGKREYLSDFRNSIKYYHNAFSIYFNTEKFIDSIHIYPMNNFQQYSFSQYVYYSGSLDNVIPATFYINFYNEHPKYTLSATVIRYIFPGLHFQISSQQKNRKLPTFRRVFTFNAFKEGWQLYVLRLACKEKLFRDPYSELYAYYSHIISAHKLIIDIKINRERWNRQQAIDYLMQEINLSKVSAETEVDECVVEPGKASAALVGYAKIIDLKKKAQQELKDKFVLKDFHNALLKEGAVPLHVIDKVIDQYINEKNYDQ